jgi:hypothetical protein
LARIPAEQLVRAPGFARDHMTLPALPNGLCPMLQSGKCSIYHDRPQTCLDYDCRIFAAAGIDAGGADKAVINRRVRQWRFSYPSKADERVHAAVLAAAEFIQKKRACFSAGRVPAAPTGIAVLAIKAHAVFLAADIDARSDAEIAASILEAGRRFDTTPVP